ncbi:MAG: GHKL domain-containing protein [Lachnospiraceae bacterium]|nr:GHKL domain-containing protein [Lachnospiraceae bacterium]
MCVVGNLVDNAIEAVIALPIEERKINISIEHLKGNVFINIHYPYEGTIKKNKDGDILSSKHDIQNHGIG